MDENEDWNATRAFEEMEEMDAQDSGKKQPRPKKRSRISAVTVTACIVAVAAVALIGVMVYSSMGVGKEASAVSTQELTEAMTAEKESAEMTVIDLNENLTVTSGGASTSADETAGQQEEEEMAEDAEASDATDDDYIFPDSSTRYLTDEDLAGLSSGTLRLARNEIYARHGYIFSDESLQNYFNSKSWYKGTTPAANFNENVLNEVEKANISKIQSYE